MSTRLELFRRYREKMNERILAAKHLPINRFFTLDTKAREDGALDARTEEFAGLTASMVLRCDDCIAYHVIRCKELGATRTQLFEALSSALIVGGSIGSRLNCRPTLANVEKLCRALDVPFHDMVERIDEPPKPKRTPKNIRRP